jgi:hypothetical protein
MRCPSAKTLEANFRDLEHKDANLIRRLAAASGDDEALGELLSSDTRLSYTERTYRHTLRSPSGRVTAILHAINKILGTHGVEPLGNDYEYLNAGDQYSATLIYDKRGRRLFVSTWSDMVEQHPKLLTQRVDDDY